MDKLDAMRAFVEVAKQGSFTKASQTLGMSPQLVSKYVSHLESLLATRLLNRTTRRVSVTEFGHRYMERCEQLLIDLDELENTAQQHSMQPSGTLRISAPVSFSTQHLARAIVLFQRQFPSVVIDLQLNDRKIDLVQEGVDIALRIGVLKDSSLIAQKITPIRLALCASPDYLNAYGTPKSRDDLAEHHYLHYSYMGAETLSRPSEMGLFKKSHCNLVVNNGDLLVQAAIEGAGIVLQPTFIVSEALKSGKLVQILSGEEPEPFALYAMYAHRQFVSQKVTAFIAFIKAFYTDVPYWDAMLSK